MIGQIYSYVKPIDYSSSNGVTIKGNEYISVQPMKPISYELTIRWYVDNVEVVEALDSKSFRASDYGVAPGLHVVKVRVLDPTPFVKDPTIISNKLTQEKE
ncbi:MAG: hypothetical protein IT292_11735 [Deltaproteobacteria bacterium]|nr:hypothetical protein [Deltaproteobacteria bacterium]